MRAFYLSILLILFYSATFAQNSLSGEVLNNEGYPLPYSSVVLLNPNDSTMEFFGISNTAGNFNIKGIKSGEYLLQIAYLGYKTLYKPVKVPILNNSIGPVALQPRSESIDEVSVNANYVPFQLKKDTIEFNTAAFKVKPDAMTEDLLRRFPGIEIDRAGNIKAFGEDVKKVLVDGKEFFGSDPKVATRNVPADAIDKVQVYDKKSDEAEFTGIDDGVRSKTLNLTLKEDKKDALFGDIQAGSDFQQFGKSSAKAYRFDDKVQMALLGMYNNVNQFGFSFSDYMNFQGGLHGMGLANGIQIGDENSFPVNFGQPVTGITSSGAGGFNYSYTKDDHNKVYVSYLGNASNKKLEQQIATTNFTETETYQQNESIDEDRNNQNHRLNFGLRKRMGENSSLILNANGSLGAGNSLQNLFYTNSADGNMVNTLDGTSEDDFINYSISGNGSFLRKFSNKKTVFKMRGSYSYYNTTSNNAVDNITQLLASNTQSLYQQKQEEQVKNSTLNVGSSLTQKLSSKFFLGAGIALGNSLEYLDRYQAGNLLNSATTDTISPALTKNYKSLISKLSLQRNTEKAKLTLAMYLEMGQQEVTMKGENSYTKTYLHPQPNISYEYEYKSGRRIMADFYSRLNTPSTSQLLPTANSFNPLMVYYGNPDLEPEVVNSASSSWFLFDQFTFTSLMVGARGEYTQNKINWAHTVNNDLSRSSKLINVDGEYRVSGSVDFSTAISKLGMKVNLDLRESYSHGSSFVNDVENQNSNRTHRVSLSLENRKKNKFDMASGVGARFTNSKYSLQESLNRNYRDYSWFGELRYTPSKKWNFEFVADIVNYNSQGFSESYNIPLLTAEASYYFMKNKRAMLSLYAFDLLDKNNIVQRTSEMNFLRETQSNTIGRYVLLTFKYRLNKFGDNSSGIDIEFNGR